MWESLHVKYSLFLSDFNETWIFLRDFWEKLKYQILLKSVVWEPSCSVRMGRTDMAKLIVALRKFANAPKCKKYDFSILIRYNKLRSNGPVKSALAERHRRTFAPFLCAHHRAISATHGIFVKNSSHSLLMSSRPPNWHLLASSSIRTLNRQLQTCPVIAFRTWRW